MALGRTLCAALLMLTLACCASITSYQDPVPHESEGLGPPGLEGYYFLPRTMLTIEIKTVGDVAVAPPKAATTGAAPGTPGTPTPAPASPPDSGSLVAVENVTLTKKVEADPFARLLYRFEPSAFADDSLQVDTDESGLLNTVSSDTTDQTGNIALAIADTVFAIATHGAPNPLAKSFRPEPKTPFKASFDPLDPVETERVRAALLQRGYCLLVASEIDKSERLLAQGDAIVIKDTKAQDNAKKMPPGPEQTQKLDDIAKDATTRLTRLEDSLQSLCVRPHGAAEKSPIDDYTNRNPGIYYRRPTPLPLAIYKLQDSNNPSFNVNRPSLLWTGSVPVFSKGEIYQVKIDRAAFVRKQTVIKFTNGSLTSVKLDKNSEVLAGLNIPVKIIRIAFAAPLAGLQQETALTKAQGDLIAAQTNLVRLQAAQISQTTVTLQTPP